MPTDTTSIKKITFNQEGRMLWAVIHEKKLDRTSVLLYFNVPDGYIIQEFKKTTVYGPEYKTVPKKEKEKLRKLYKKEDLIKQKKEIEKIFADLNYDPTTFNPATTFEFLLFADPDAGKETRYFRYLLDGANHKVSFKIDFDPEMDPVATNDINDLKLNVSSEVTPN